jgi:hypothetical protein
MAIERALSHCCSTDHDQACLACLQDMVKNGVWYPGKSFQQIGEALPYVSDVQFPCTTSTLPACQSELLWSAPHIWPDVVSEISL